MINMTGLHRTQLLETTLHHTIQMACIPTLERGQIDVNFETRSLFNILTTITLHISAA